MTKNDIIKVLSDNKDNYTSGEFLAETLGLSRTAIWKGINALKEEGFEIEAIRNKGYRLCTNNDILNAEMIKKYLTKPDFYTIECYNSMISTNSALQQRFTETEGLVIVANSQENGKGRINRNFYSPKNTGIYFSILLKPNLEKEKTNYITAMAGIAVCKAIQKTVSLSPHIKWVNDIYLDNKKVCGILTQGSFSLENNLAEYLVLGIGINVYDPQEGFPTTLKHIAGSITTQKKDNLRNTLLAEVLNEFYLLYSVFNIPEIVAEYKSFNFIIDQEVIIINENSQSAKVLDIDNNCALVVQYETGEIKTLNSGEISIRPTT